MLASSATNITPLHHFGKAKKYYRSNAAACPSYLSGDIGIFT